MPMNKEQFDAAIQDEQRIDAAIGANKYHDLSLSPPRKFRWSAEQL